MTAKESRLGSIPSFLNILAHLAIKSRQSSDLEEVINHIAPWLMAQHFATRICSQVSFKKLYEIALRTEDKEMFVTKYGILLTCIKGCIKQGNYGKNLDKLEEDFFLMEFDPVTNFNLTDIFHHIPRLSGIMPFEWENFDEISENLTFRELKIKLKCANSTLQNRNLQSKSKDSAVNLANPGGDAEIIQKKITPWTSMFNDLDMFVMDEAGDKTPEYPNLIMIASLIDKIPNLGGLCRTCEILGVGEYVISSSKYTEEKDFKVSRTDNYLL